MDQLSPERAELLRQQETVAGVNAAGIEHVAARTAGAAAGRACFQGKRQGCFHITQRMVMMQPRSVQKIPPSRQPRCCMIRVAMKDQARQIRKV